MSLDNTKAMLTTHVDDLALTATKEWLDEHYNKFVKKFGKVTRQQLPFDHCGCRYSKTKDGFAIDQKEFAEKMKPAPIPKRADDSKLTPSEVSDLRSILGALLWITATRLDVIADISVLQSRVTIATVKELKLANEVLVKVRNHAEAALHYRQFKTSRQRVVCIHDASSANNGRHYAQEGILVLLADDSWFHHDNESEVEYDSEGDKMHGGVMHVLHSHGGKAKRVSYSTSHAETLSMVNGVESTTLVMIRLSEMMHVSPNPTVKQLTEIQESGNPMLPCDYYMDCKDLFELCAGQKTLPQDKSQRLYVLGIKESRITGQIRMVVLIPTESMLSDGLTKPMISAGLLLLLTTGLVSLFGVRDHPIVSRILPSLQEYDEHDLLKDDNEIRKLAMEKPEVVRASHSSILLGLVEASGTPLVKAAMLCSFLVGSQAQAMELYENRPPPTSSITTTGWFFGMSLHYVVMFMVVILAIIVERRMTRTTIFILKWLFKIQVYLMKAFGQTMLMKVKEEDDVDPADRKIGDMSKMFDQQMQDMLAENDAIMEKNKKLENDADQERRYAIVMKDSRDWYSAETAPLESELKLKKDQLAQVEFERKSAQDAYAALVEKQAKSTEHFNQHTFDMLQKDKEITGLKRKVDHLNEIMNNQDRRFNAKEEELARKEEQLVQAEKSLKDAYEKYDNMENQALEWKRNYEIEVDQASTMETKFYELQATHHKLRMELNELKEEQETQEHPAKQARRSPEASSSSNRERELEAQLAAATKKIADDATKIEHLELAEDRLRAAVQQARYPDEIRVTATGRKYHVGNCNHLGATYSSTGGYTPCRGCCV